MAALSGDMTKPSKIHTGLNTLKMSSGSRPPPPTGLSPHLVLSSTNLPFSSLSPPGLGEGGLVLPFSWGALACASIEIVSSRVPNDSLCPPRAHPRAGPTHPFTRDTSALSFPREGLRCLSPAGCYFPVSTTHGAVLSK